MLPELRRREKIQTRFLPEDEQDLSACERQKEDKVTGDRGFPRYVPDQSACVTLKRAERLSGYQTVFATPAG
ncbi:hypothetical protein PLESHI_03862 [Plesiomonas shigelloides 302-73]|uniref:Uncharacterized protein n=1 Tax=Plesiomonas shigelloides 302-73 TaxID=1315976 RepID=R8ATL7_PLESH|nr:hypothetical protein PLESHI_03862 [Plesiomonas shigelloides 302-73]